MIASVPFNFIEEFNIPILLYTKQYVEKKTKAANKSVRYFTAVER